MSCLETAAAVKNLEATVKGMLPDAETRVQVLENQAADRLKNINTGFCLVDTLMDGTKTPITLNPRFASIQNAIDFQFSAPEDYAPTGCYTDLQSTMPAQQVWYSEPAPKMFTNRVSIYANIAVGSNPHPSPKSEVRVAILQSVIGEYHQLVTTLNPIPNYSEPRLLLGKANMESFSLKGRSYEITNYDDLFALAENELSNFSVGFSFIRIINLGNLPIHIKGLWMVHHGELK
jgi:hypothetical protein